MSDKFPDSPSATAACKSTATACLRLHTDIRHSHANVADYRRNDNGNCPVHSYFYNHDVRRWRPFSRNVHMQPTEAKQHIRQSQIIPILFSIIFSFVYPVLSHKAFSSLICFLIIIPYDYPAKLIYPYCLSISCLISPFKLIIHSSEKNPIQPLSRNRTFVPDIQKKAGGLSARFFWNILFSYSLSCSATPSFNRFVILLIPIYNVEQL